MPIRWLSRKAKVCERTLPNSRLFRCHISRAHTRFMDVAPHELREDGLYPVAKPAEQGTPLGITAGMQEAYRLLPQFKICSKLDFSHHAA